MCERTAAAWREEFDHVRKDRDETLGQLHDAERQIENLHTLLRRTVQRLVYVHVSMMREITARCRLCRGQVPGEDIWAIQHDMDCPVPHALHLLGLAPARTGR